MGEQSSCRTTVLTCHFELKKLRVDWHSCCLANALHLHNPSSSMLRAEVTGLPDHARPTMEVTRCPDAFRAACLVSSWPCCWPAPSWPRPGRPPRSSRGGSPW
ncbi:protein of unknown function [Rhodovastum atsumiense]|nr:protein of unknown function [Rhodovastum atsumiense]